MYTAWGILLQKYNNSEQALFGTTVSGRNAKVKGIEEIVGLFINTLPLILKKTPGEKITAIVHRIDETLKKREQFEHTSLIDIKEYNKIENIEELFDTIVVIENYPLDKYGILHPPPGHPHPAAHTRHPGRPTLYTPQEPPVNPKECWWGMKGSSIS